MTSNFITIGYETREFPFQAVLASHVFKVERIDRLHLVGQPEDGEAKLGYSDNLRLRARMQRLPGDSLFFKIYHRWIARVLAPHYGGRISYSARPKMRVHLAGTGTVSNFHCDADVTGREDQINCYLPFTDVYDTCTLWCEANYGREDYRPLNLRYGQALLWDGGRLRHGTFANATPSTRVSCDFRFHARDPGRVKSPWRDVLAGRCLADVSQPAQ